MPPRFAFTLLLLVWVVSLVAGVPCLRIPSLAAIPPGFLLWSKAVDGQITGLRYTTHLDIAPLPEVAMCIAAGLLIGRASAWIALRLHGSDGVPGAPSRTAGAPSKGEFAQLVLRVAVAVHLANYFWSFVAKATLQGPFMAWLRENDPAYARQSVQPGARADAP